jgi:glycosyltransferase involved in cell wall biosynthesis
MACGVPVIGTNIGGIPEVIVDGETGYLVEVGNTEEVAEKAIAILSDSEKHKRFSKKAVTHVSENFHSEKIVNAYEDVYNSLVKG